MNPGRKKAQFRPCIDLHDGKVKQIIGSTLSDSGNGLKTNFIADRGPAWFAELYRRDNLRGGHVIKLGPGNDDAAKEALAAWPGGLQVGGGITAENAAMWLDAGAAQVIVTSYIFRDGLLHMDLLEKLFRITGRDRLTLDLSCRRGRDGAFYIVTDRWQKFTSLRVEEQTLCLLAKYCTEFLIHAVDVEGKQSGTDRELLHLLAESSPIDCVYAGGISSLEEIADIDAWISSAENSSTMKSSGFDRGKSSPAFRRRELRDQQLEPLKIVPQRAVLLLPGGNHAGEFRKRFAATAQGRPVPFRFSEQLQCIKSKTSLGRSACHCRLKEKSDRLHRQNCSAAVEKRGTSLHPLHLRRRKSGTGTADPFQIDPFRNNSNTAGKPILHRFRVIIEKEIFQEQRFRRLYGSFPQRSNLLSANGDFPGGLLHLPFDPRGDL